MDSFQHETTQYLYKRRLDEKLTAKQGILVFPKYMETLILSLHETAKEVLGGKHKRQSRKMWWTEEIEGLVAKKEKRSISEMVKHKKGMKISMHALKLRDSGEE